MFVVYIAIYNLLVKYDHLPELVIREGFYEKTDLLVSPWRLHKKWLVDGWFGDLSFKGFPLSEITTKLLKMTPYPAGLCTGAVP